MRGRYILSFFPGYLIEETKNQSNSIERLMFGNRTKSSFSLESKVESLESVSIQLFCVNLVSNPTRGTPLSGLNGDVRPVRVYYRESFLGKCLDHGIVLGLML